MATTSTLSEAVPEAATDAPGATRGRLPRVPPIWEARAWHAACRTLVQTYFQLDVRGKANVPRRGGGIVIANHPSYVDPFVVGLGAWPRWITWMCWEEAFAWPVFGRALHRLGALPVRLERPQPSTLKASHAAIAAGRLLGIFFEGGRTLGPGALDPPRRGSARMALVTGVPVVPVTISGLRRLWPVGRTLPRSGRVRVEFHAPIDAATFEPELPMREREALLTARLTDVIGAPLPGRAER